MICMQRQATVVSAAKNMEALTFASEVTAYTDKLLPGHNMRCWIQLGGSFPTVHWSIEFPDLADYEQSLATVMLDEHYNEMVAGASDCWLAGSVQDTLLRSL